MAKQCINLFICIRDSRGHIEQAAAGSSREEYETFSISLFCSLPARGENTSAYLRGYKRALCSHTPLLRECIYTYTKRVYARDDCGLQKGERERAAGGGQAPRGLFDKSFQSVLHANHLRARERIYACIYTCAHRRL